MGLLGAVKKWAAQREAAALGKDLATSGGRMGTFYDWLKRNKVTVGAVFVGVSGWVTGECQPVVGVNVLSVLHLTCGQLTTPILILGAFLSGAGLVTSDKHAAVIQGVIPPSGPPKPEVSAPLSAPPA